MSEAVYRRVLLKLSGEAFGDADNSISPDVVASIASQLVDVTGLGVEIGVVVGGGNIFRGTSPQASGMDRSSADAMGMLGTVINALALSDACEKRGLPTRVQSAVAMSQLAEPYIRRRAIRHLEKGRLVIFAAGLGAPYFSTDTAAAQRALEIDAEVLLKATKVDGVYDRDPALHVDAVRFSSITYQEVQVKGLRVMDETAVSLCKDNALPIVVFELRREGNIRRVLCGEPVGSLVHSAGYQPPAASQAEQADRSQP